MAQNKEPFQMKNWELRQYAKDAKKKKRYVIALKYYTELYARKPNNQKYKYNVALLYYKTNNYTNSKEIFFEIYSNKKYKHIEALYYYAESCRKLGEIVEAEESFMKFVDICPKKFQLLKYFALNAIESINYKQDSCCMNNVQIIHLNKTINYPHLETSPVIINDTCFVYSSNSLDTIKIVDNKSFNNLNVFYVATKINGNWNGGGVAPKPFVNITDHSIANGVFSPDKTRFYFTVKEPTNRGFSVSKLYVSERINGVWSDPQKLKNKINLPFYNSTQPTVGITFDPNLEVIYFISNRQGGLGGNDIWFTVYDKIHQTYTVPSNAGGYINTPGDEMTPFYDNKNKTMYFSSNGLPGFGGFDIFKTIGSVSNWIPAENIGTPLNTCFDDLYFSKFQHKNKGFFISNRTEAYDWGQENCCFDIFMFDALDNNKIIITGQLLSPLLVINQEIEKIINNDDYVLDSTASFLGNTVVNLEIQDQVDSSYFSLYRDTTDNMGRYQFTIEKGQNYLMSINAKGYLFSSCDFSTQAITNDTLNVDCLKAIPDSNQNIILKNILFEYNSADLTLASKVYLDSVIVPIMQYYDNIIVEIGAHTDNKGSFDYNIELSQDRAESVVNFLVASGISSIRLIAKGYGETKHLVPELNADGSDNSNARQINRRVEFKIVGQYQN